MSATAVPQHENPTGPAPDTTGPRPALSVVPAYQRLVCRCIPCVLTVADHHHTCPHFRPA